MYHILCLKEVFVKIRGVEKEDPDADFKKSKGLFQKAKTQLSRISKTWTVAGNNKKKQDYGTKCKTMINKPMKKLWLWGKTWRNVSGVIVQG